MHFFCPGVPEENLMIAKFNIMKSITDKNLTFTFSCECGSDSFKRNKQDEYLKSFFEGSFYCSNENCNKEHDYTSKAFKRNYTQTSLFN